MAAKEASDEDLDDKFADMLAEWYDSKHSGRPSSPLESVEDLQLRGRLVESQECLELLESVWSKDSALTRDSQQTKLPHDGDSSHLKTLSGDQSSSNHLLASVMCGVQGEIGRFQILKELGRGGHGIVFLAFDPRLNRQVALKVPKPENLISPSKQARFQREAQFAARLKHPNLVSIFEIGEMGPISFLVTEYCRGSSFHRWLKALETALSPVQTVRLLLPIVDAVAFMHWHGVIHRDIKPGNILLDEPTLDVNAPMKPGALKLTDFGLSTLSDLSNRHTQTGAILGTLAYMAPEQIDKQRGTAGAPLDIYALGVVLYESLTGRLPIEGETDAELIHHLLNAEPLAPRRLRQAIPVDLEVICLKCLEKDPRRRYASTNDLVSDLRAFLDGKTIQARPATSLERGAKWIRRHPAKSLLGLVSAAAMICILSLTTLYNLTLQEHSQSLKRALDQAESSQTQLRLENYAIEINSAFALLKSDRRGDLKAFLESLRVKQGTKDIRGFEWFYLNLIANQEWTLRGHLYPLNSINASPDERTMASSAADGTVRLWDLADETSTVVINEAESRKHLNFYSWLTYEKSGDHLFALVDFNGHMFLSVVDTRDKRETARFNSDHTKNLITFVQLPEQHELGLVTIGSDKLLSVQRWNWTTGELKAATITTPQVSLEAHPLVKKKLASPGHFAGFWVGDHGDSTLKQLIYITAHNGVRIEQISLPTNNVNTASLGISDGEVVLGTTDGEIIRWNVMENRLIARWREELSETVEWVEPLPNRNMLASAYFATNSQPDLQNSMRIRDSMTGRLLETWDRGVKVRQATWMNGRETLAIACHDRSIRMWRPFSQSAISVLKPAGTKEAWAIAFSQDSSHLAVGYDDEAGLDRETLKIWNVHTKQEDHFLVGHSAMVTAVTFDSAGDRLFSTGFDGKIKAWDWKRNQLMNDVVVTQDQFRGLAISPGDNVLAAAGQNCVINLWDSTTGSRIPTDFVAHQDLVHTVALDPTGEWLATLDNTFEVRLWNRRTGRLVRAILDHQPVLGLAFSPDGNRLVSVNEDGLISLYDLHDEKFLFQFAGHKKNARAIVFSPDGRTLASGGQDGVRLWHVGTGHELMSFEDLPARVNRLAFSPDQKHLAAALLDGSVYIWHASGTSSSEER